MRPFLKWVGGKYRLREKIKALLPPGDCLIEPFVGSGAIFLNTDYKHYILGDSNPDLINIFKHLKKERSKFIDYCASFFNADTNAENIFNQNREIFNTTTDARLKAALFLYLNRHGYNGLIRYNSKGGFNVPFGRYEKPLFPAKEMIAFADKAKIADFFQADFQTTMKKAKAGNVIYCDPPYMPLTSTARFTQYSIANFGLIEQTQLAKIAKKINKKGITIVISNHDTALAHKIYQGAKMHHFEVQRQISCDGNNRNKAKEILAVFS